MEHTTEMEELIQIETPTLFIQLEAISTHIDIDQILIPTIMDTIT